MWGESSAQYPGGSVLKLGLGLAGGGLGARREASGHIAYKSPGHIYTENCLARATATLSGDGLTLIDTVPHAMHTYMHNCTGWKKKRERGESSSESWRDLWPVWQLNST